MDETDRLNNRVETVPVPFSGIEEALLVDQAPQSRCPRCHSQHSFHQEAAVVDLGFLIFQMSPDRPDAVEEDPDEYDVEGHNRP